MRSAPPLPPVADTGAPDTGAPDRPSGLGPFVGLTFAGALAFAVVTRGGQALVGLAVLFLVFVPIERLFALRPQKVFRRGLLTDLTHLFVNSFFVTVGAIALGVVFA